VATPTFDVTHCPMCFMLLSGGIARSPMNFIP
jgi:hypothetical protein